MSLLSTCYGPDIEALADLDGGFEALSTDALLEFALRQWKDVAATLGFHAALARSVGAVGMTATFAAAAPRQVAGVARSGAA